METRHLEFFVAVAEELSFTRAAARQFAVQSTVSAVIRSLEKDLGTPLFERSTKRVALTPAGEAFLPAARAAIEAIDTARSSVVETTAGIRGRLRVGIFASLELFDLPAIFGDFHTRYPLVDLQLTASQSGSSGFADDVRRGRLDVAFMGLPLRDLHDLQTLPLATTEIVAVLPSSHALASEASVRLSQLAGEPFVDTPPGFGNRVVLERALAEEGLSRTVSTVVSDLGEVPRFVASGLGIALVPGALVVPASGTVVIPLEQRIEWMISVVYRDNPSPATSALLGLLRERANGASHPPVRV